MEYIRDELNRQPFSLVIQSGGFEKRPCFGSTLHMPDGQGMIVLFTITLLGLGFVNCFYGFRIFRLTLSLIGFLLGFALGISYFSASDSTVTVMGIFAGVILGLAGAGIFRRVYFLGIFLGGAVFGVVVAAATLTAAGVEPHIVVIMVGAVIGGILALFVNKVTIILSTAFGGAAAILVGAGSMLFEESPEGAAISALFFMLWIVLGMAGSVVQIKAGGTRSKPDPEKRAPEPQWS